MRAKGRQPGNPSGASLLETLAALSIAAVAMTFGLQTARAVASTLRLEAARLITLRAMLGARRLAYASAGPVVATPSARAIDVDAGPAGTRRFALPATTSIIEQPRSGRVRFHASGLADNATLVLGCASCGETTTRVVVNQRAMVR